MSADAGRLWHPLASFQDVVPRHVFWGRLLGRELAVWRADDGFVNVWENRCLHRGVRLTVGTNDGRELVCRYHGWRYASRTAGCTYIPAHPADAPARTICNRTFPAVERYGLVWSGADPDGEPPTLDALEAAGAFGLRGVAVRAPSDLVIDALSRHRFSPTDRIGVPGDGAGAAGDADVDMTVTDRGRYHLVLRADSRGGGPASTIVFFAQPADADRTVIRAVLAGEPDPSSRIPVWRHHNTALSQLREAVEAEARRRPAPEPMVASIEEVPIRLSEMPEPAPKGRRAALRVQVARKWQAAADVAGFDLVSIAGQLPTFQPGAHIDVHLPNALVRQYSLTNGPGELDRYRIGVKLEPDGGGGSLALHDSVRVGDVLAVSEPRNNFPLRRDAVRTILVAGGIGITPLLAMAQALRHQGLDFELHVFARSDDHIAFAELVDGLGEAVTRHIGLSPAETGAAAGGASGRSRTPRARLRVRSGPDARRGAPHSRGRGPSRRHRPLRVLRQPDRDRRLDHVHGGPGPLRAEFGGPRGRHRHGGAAVQRRGGGVRRARPAPAARAGWRCSTASPSTTTCTSTTPRSSRATR